MVRATDLPGTPGTGRGIFKKAQAVVQDARDASIGNSVSDADAVSPVRNDSQVREPLELIAHRLRLHVDCFG
jgi:hypothetical protein